MQKRKKQKKIYPALSLRKPPPNQMFSAVFQISPYWRVTGVTLLEPGHCTHPPTQTAVESRRGEDLCAVWMKALILDKGSWYWMLRCLMISRYVVHNTGHWMVVEPRCSSFLLPSLGATQSHSAPCHIRSARRLKNAACSCMGRLLSVNTSHSGFFFLSLLFRLEERKMEMRGAWKLQKRCTDNPMILCENPGLRSLSFQIQRQRQ